MPQERNASSLVVKIQSLLPSLTAAEKRVAHYTIEHPEDVVQCSVSDLAERSHSSDATVIRTIKKLGSLSFTEFKVALAQSTVAPVKVLDSEIESGDSPAAVAHKVFDSVWNTIAMTRDIINYDDMEKAADLLFGASRILLFGLGNSASVVTDFEQKLMRLGRPVITSFDPHLFLIHTLNYAGPGTVCFAVSHSGRSKLVVDAARRCRERGCCVISLTDMAPSPLKDMADISLCTMSGETKYNLYASASKIAQHTVIDALYTTMSYKHIDDSLARFREIQTSMGTYKENTRD